MSLSSPVTITAGVVVSCGATWALMNSTWAMVYGLTRAYEVQENRSMGALGVTIVALTATLALMASAAVAGALFIPGPTVQWLILAMALGLWFSVLYRFAPNVRNHKWRCSAPGALAALVLWIGATIGVRVYFDHIDDCSRSFGGLNGVAMLLLWLFVTNGAILIGGELNSEIEKAVMGRAVATPGGRTYD